MPIEHIRKAIEHATNPDKTGTNYFPQGSQIDGITAHNLLLMDHFALLCTIVAVGIAGH
jgi:hypothetical protein